MTKAAAGRLETLSIPAASSDSASEGVPGVTSSSQPEGELSPCLDSLIEMTATPAGELEEMKTMVPRKHKNARAMARVGGTRKSCDESIDQLDPAAVSL
jgi:hypothetical protein